MGKYMRKAKATGDLAVMEVTAANNPGGGGGVRTRAARAAAAAAADSVGKSSGGGTSYLQLRSRLLIKKPTGSGVRRRRRKGKGKGKEEGGEEGERGKEEGDGKGVTDPEAGKGCGGAVGDGENGEASCGDNAMELEGRERSTRESTPCSLIRDTDGVTTPSSTTKPTGLTQTNRRGRSADRRNIPSTNEMDDFFTGAEEEQQKSFIDKYNFDPVNEKPLPGRFEWEKLDPEPKS